MTRVLLAFLLFFCSSVLQAQPAKVDKELEIKVIRKSVRETVPHFLTVLGSAKVMHVRRTYLFLNHNSATDTINLVNKFLPDSILASTSYGFGLKVDCLTHRVYGRKGNSWQLLNTDSVYLREIPLDSIPVKGFERFLLNATIAFFMDKAKIEEIEASETKAGRLHKVAYIQFPSRGDSYLDLMAATTNRFCPDDDDTYEGVSNEVVPYGGILVCYRKFHR